MYIIKANIVSKLVDIRITRKTLAKVCQTDKLKLDKNAFIYMDQ